MPLDEQEFERLGKLEMNYYSKVQQAECGQVELGLGQEEGDWVGAGGEGLR